MIGALLLALTCFLAGVAVGLWLAGPIDPLEPEPARERP